jgi:hypothetical protein
MMALKCERYRALVTEKIRASRLFGGIFESPLDSFMKRLRSLGVAISLFPLSNPVVYHTIITRNEVRAEEPRSTEQFCLERTHSLVSAGSNATGRPEAGRRLNTAQIPCQFSTCF